jgi:hypothetical protein
MMRNYFLAFNQATFPHPGEWMLLILLYPEKTSLCLAKNEIGYVLTYMREIKQEQRIRQG